MFLDDKFDYNHDGRLDSWEQADRNQVLYEMQLPREKRTSEFSRIIDNMGIDPYYGASSEYDTGKVRDYTSRLESIEDDEEEIDEGELYELEEAQRQAEWEVSITQEAISYVEHFLADKHFSYDRIKHELGCLPYDEDIVNKALEHCEIDWNEHVVEAAKDYIDNYDITTEELEESLHDDGYTDSQIKYAIGVTRSSLFEKIRKTAVNDAMDLLVSLDICSLQTLIDNLECDYELPVAKLAAKDLNADWNFQAEKAAKYMIENYHIWTAEDLEYELSGEGFTDKETRHAIRATKLQLNELSKQKCIEDIHKCYEEKLDLGTNEIIEKLGYNDYTIATIKYAIENCGIDWNERAVEYAMSLIEGGYVLSGKDLREYLVVARYKRVEIKYALEKTQVVIENLST